MTLPAPTYDLVLLLDTQAEDSTRAKILDDARSSIQARGELLRHDEWGERPLAYPISRRKSAEYHLFQFHVSDDELLHGLDRTLRITDGVVRFRLIKLRPGVPDPPDMRSSSAPVRRAEGEAPARPAPATDGEAPAAEAPAAAAPAAEAPDAQPDASPTADAQAGESASAEPASGETAVTVEEPGAAGLQAAPDEAPEPAAG